MYPRVSTRWFGVTCAVALGLGNAAAAPAGDSSGNAAVLAAAPRVLVVPWPAEDWVRRVQGQLSDLPASLATAPTAPPGVPPGAPPASPEQLRHWLARLAEQHAAALVASIVRRDTAAGERTLVAIWFSESQLLYVRVLADDWRRLSANDRSGALELAALSVRSAVRALTLDPAEIEAFAEAGAALPAASAASAASPGTAPSAAEASAAAPDPLVDPAVVVQVVQHPSARPEGVADTASARDTAGTPLELHWSGELGMLGYLQGEPALASAALQLGLGVASGAWGLSVRGQLGIPTTSSLGPAQVELQRYAVLAEVGYFGWNAGAWQFGPLLRAGVTLTERETSSENPALAASDSRSLGSLLLGGGWSSEYRWSERFGLVVRAGLDWQASPVSYAVVTTTGEPVASAAAWPLQPSLELAGNWHW